VHDGFIPISIARAERNPWRDSPALGLGFVLIELPLMQRFVLI